VDYPRSAYAVESLFYLVKDAMNRGDLEGALALLERVEREYPDREEEVARAMIERAMLLEAHDRWSEALAVFRELPIRHPITEAALNVPIEIVNHHSRTGDAKGRAAAIDEAETAYRTFIERYPAGAHTLSARFKLAQTLVLQEEYEEAAREFLAVGEAMGNTSMGAAAFLRAATLRQTELDDPGGAAAILDRAADVFGARDFGLWAAARAGELREEPRP
jgi:TolA-binding protein